MLLKSGGGSKTRFLRTASQFHGRMAEEEEEKKYTTQLDGRRSSSYCKNMYLPPSFPQTSLITMGRRLKRVGTQAIVTSKMRVTLCLLPRRPQVTAVMNELANELGATPNPSGTRHVASVVRVINTNRTSHLLFPQFLRLLVPCSVCRHTIVHISWLAPRIPLPWCPVETRVNDFICNVINTTMKSERDICAGPPYAKLCYTHLAKLRFNFMQMLPLGWTLYLTVNTFISAKQSSKIHRYIQYRICQQFTSGAIHALCPLREPNPLLGSIYFSGDFSSKGSVAIPSRNVQAHYLPADQPS